jgi:APA family basic amino acid/polyamine antiporter
VGLGIYFAYGQRHSRLNEKFAGAKAAVNGGPARSSDDDLDDDKDALTKV